MRGVSSLNCYSKNKNKFLCFYSVRDMQFTTDRDSMWLTQEQKFSKQMAGDTERSLSYLVCWLASHSFFPCPNQDGNGYLALLSPSARQEVNLELHIPPPLAFVERTEATAEPDLTQALSTAWPRLWATGLCKHQRNISISPFLVQTGRYVGPTTKRALGPKSVYNTKNVSKWDCL